MSALMAALLMNAVLAPLEAYQKLCEDYGPDALVEGAGLWRELGLSASVQGMLAELLAKGDWPEQERDRMERIGARFVSVEDPDYPARLRDLPRPPIGLYVKGRIDLSLPSVAVVGTRRCSAYGQNTAEGLGRALARNRFILVSGGARGIDGAGHRGCLKEGGMTVAVMGTGLDRVYPAEHRDLFARIAETGALVSEFPMGSGGEGWHFPERNRVIVALAGRTVVVESPEDGGAMITARLALDLGRDLWCVPGRIGDEVCRGSNQLLRDGAQVLTDIGEFIQCISGSYGQLVLALEPTRPQVPLSADEKVLLSLLQRQGGRTVDDLLAESGLDLVTLQSGLLSLTVSGLVIASGPGRYSASL